MTRPTAICGRQANGGTGQLPRFLGSSFVVFWRRYCISGKYFPGSVDLAHVGRTGGNEGEKGEVPNDPPFRDISVEKGTSQSRRGHFHVDEESLLPRNDESISGKRPTFRPVELSLVESLSGTFRDAPRLSDHSGTSLISRSKAVERPGFILHRAVLPAKKGGKKNACLIPSVRPEPEAESSTRNGTYGSESFSVSSLIAPRSLFVQSREQIAEKTHKGESNPTEPRKFPGGIPRGKERCGRGSLRRWSDDDNDECIIHAWKGVCIVEVQMTDLALSRDEKREGVREREAKASHLNADGRPSVSFPGYLTGRD